jgi:putative ABC transport system permease protein
VIAKLVFENIRHRVMRTVLSTLLIGIPVMLILIIVGLSHGLVDDSKARARGIGADIAVRAPGSSVMSMSGATIPEQLIAKLAARPHVAMAIGTVNQSAGGILDIVTGIDTAAFNRMSGGFDFIEGHGLEKPDDIVLDRYYAEQRHVHAGDQIELLHRKWKIAGVAQPGKLSHVFVQMSVLQDLFSTKGMVSSVYLKVDDPKNINTVIDALKADPTLKEYPVLAMQDLIDLTSVDRVPYLSSFLNVIIGLCIVISFAVVSLSMYMAILQRTREIGILKAIGASKTFILSLIVLESLIMAMGGAILGIVFSFGSRFLLLKFVPSSLPQAIVPIWWLYATFVVIVAALMGACYPGLAAARHDPIEALSYE